MQNPHVICDEADMQGTPEISSGAMSSIVADLQI